MGRAALVVAVRAYDPERAPFVPYVVQRLKWAIQEGVRSASHGRCKPRRRLLACTIGSAHGALGGARGGGSYQVAVAGGARGGNRAGASLSGDAASLRPRVPLGLVEGTPEDEVLAELEADRVRRAVARLPGHERVLVVSHYFQGRQFDRVAAHLGISRSWASRLHARALRRLRRSLCRSVAVPEWAREPGGSSRRRSPSGHGQRGCSAAAAEGSVAGSSTR
jgi:RNA polymerase sigma factor for flagellar operon FliA